MLLFRPRLDVPVDKIAKLTGASRYLAEMRKHGSRLPSIVGRRGAGKAMPRYRRVPERHAPKLRYSTALEQGSPRQ
jgi:hypothetical protein